MRARLSRSALSKFSLPSSLLSTESQHETAFSLQGSVDGAMPSWPELFIFRRTKKTGSSSMMNALMDVLQPLGYYALPHMPPEMENVIRNEYRRPTPRRLMVLHHNKVTKNMHPRGRRAVIIADTLRDGFKHVTGYCRYLKGVQTCEADMEECLRSNVTLSQMRYRWAGRDHEDSETYIDLPLASDLPALSTTILRTVFPNATLTLKRYNVRGKSCADRTPAKKVYDELYGELDEQVEKLRKRMLIIAGYPYLVDSASRGNVTIEDMVAAADRIENEKYKFGEIEMAPSGKSNQVKNLLRLLQIWRRDETGKLVLVPRREDV